ncbi:peptidoglycan DD-metalloendopeptidase family protein [Marilutibacter alkalisoli]|uniref:Peptidoglycan DD-metalloendopeptidase family protein n=1 Tax=Marilutibacter alkalisoli TaxID=2591633 RepID=A0A514BXL4_9GAMM|nr:peptidoglycan DD-metalloendopeptidase family protein [Lysobacter alkalisoli]QDH71739.1 peptidoglycan DD-metalloendopeptidase family protein [Lysobacter alkalisoli]
MTPRKRFPHLLPRVAVYAVAGALVLGLAACSSTVTRTSSGSSSAGPVRTSTPKPGATAVVQRGDNLYRIATNNGITLTDLAAWNNIPPPYTIHPGQRLRLYPSSGATTATAPSRTPPASTPSSSRPASTAPAASSTAPASSGLSWRWPADGQLIARYVAGDPTKQGIGIAGNGGAAVRAAGDGVVVYSGSGLVGYGELIIIKHNDQWLSAYGHNRNRLVSEGAVVKSGQQIAEMGRSGASRDMLHFEIRYNGKPVDPLQYLPKR